MLPGGPGLRKTFQPGFVQDENGVSRSREENQKNEG